MTLLPLLSVTSTRWRLNVGRQKIPAIAKDKPCLKKRAAAHDTVLGLDGTNSVIRYLQRCRAYRDGLEASGFLKGGKLVTVAVAGQSFRLARIFVLGFGIVKPSTDISHAVNIVKFRGQGWWLKK